MFFFTNKRNISSITYLDARNRQDNLPYAVFTVMPSGPSPVKKTYKNIVQQSQKQYRYQPV